MAAAALTDPNTISPNVAKNLGLTTATFYSYENGDGSLKEKGMNVLEKAENNLSYNDSKISIYYTP